VLEKFEALLGLISQIPVESIYLLIAAGAALENVFPPVPSDVVVIAGAILADRGVLDPGLVFLVAWLGNLGLAIGVYAASRRYGASLFATRWGRWLLRPGQLERMAVFYSDYGTVTILVSRFFPVFRVLVPAFAGISRLGFWRTAVPIAAASAVWYGMLIGLGIVFSRNLPRLLGPLERVNLTAGLVALAIALLLGLLWWRTRHEEADGDPEGEPREELADEPGEGPEGIA
jgi:membrane protein DedA with SNARE-associated domain